jgi:hypothetical protein
MEFTNIISVYSEKQLLHYKIYFTEIKMQKHGPTVRVIEYLNMVTYFRKCRAPVLKQAIVTACPISKPEG